MSAKASLYIPSVKISYTEDRIKTIFGTLGLGLVDRIDFAPIMKTVSGKEEKIECNKFKQAFLYIDLKKECEWSPEIINALDENRGHKIYPNREQNEYWLILKNKTPVPYANTELNIHQLALYNSILEARIIEMEQEIKKLKEEKDEMEDIAIKMVNNYNYDEDARFIDQTLDDDDDSDSDDDETKERKAKEFVDSLEHILEMMEENNDNRVEDV